MILQRRGFTLVELLIVIVVIAILAAISIVAYNGVQDSDMAQKVDEMIDDGNIDCGKFHRHQTADNAFMYILSTTQN